MNGFIPRPGRKFQGPNRQYIKHDGKNVMLDQETIDNWDDILEFKIELIQYEQRMVDGELVPEEWSRLEVTDYTTMTRDLAVATHTKAKADLVRVPAPAVELTEQAVASLKKQLGL